MGWDDAPPTQGDIAPAAWDAEPPKPEELGSDLKNLANKAATVGMGAMEAVNAPFQVAGEAIRGAGESEPLQVATAADPRGFRAPSIVQRFVPSLRTAKPPSDPFQKSYQGLEGLMQGNLQKGADVVKGPPDTAAQVGGLGMALGMLPPKAGVPEETPTELTGGSLSPELPVKPSGAKTGDPHALFAYNDQFGPNGSQRSIYNVFGDPEHPAIKQAGWGSSLPAEEIEKSGIPITGREAQSEGYDPLGREPKETPPTGSGTSGSDPLKEVTDYISQKYGQASAKPGFSDNVANYLKHTAQKLGGKDLGIQPAQIKSMGPGFQGLNKAEALIDYAREKGYFDPTLTDIARKAKIQGVLDTTGQQISAIRSVADQRGAPPVPQILNEVKTQLTKDYGIDAPKEINRVLAKIQKAPPTFSGLSDLATDLNKAKTAAAKMGQHPGPTTDAANIVSRINNDAIRGVLNPQESQTYTQSLRDFGAHKKLEQAVASSGRRELSARSNQRGIFGRLFQEALDRGGYRVAGNVASRTGNAISKNPNIASSLPQFFEELANHTGDVVDEATQGPGMAHGGIVGEVNDHLTAKYGRPNDRQGEMRCA